MVIHIEADRKLLLVREFFGYKKKVTESNDGHSISRQSNAKLAATSKKIQLRSIYIPEQQDVHRGVQPLKIFHFTAPVQHRVFTPQQPV